ncbi:ankyrin repeat-containing domain protein [Immersiella caudata]|uniref:Ankyrin repeat-containing domain protein n=1 Tax=Immersiella caudata TaxID=314043 RepID=A0AA39X622_9PEZI|nr:ankyrin repeat-containing domain protein [Immersiella caudata]
MAFAGAGKTVMSAIVSEYLRNEYTVNHPNVGVATLYCNYQQKDDQHLDNLERSIFRQVISSMTTIPPSIKQLYGRGRRNDPKQPPQCSTLHSAVERDKGVTWPTAIVVLDALDEADVRVQDQVKERILGLPFPNVRFLCTSRPFSKFHDIFSSSAQIEIAATDKDIKTFVNSHIDENKLLSKLLKNDMKLREDIADTIITQAKKMFLMARLHVEGIETADSRAEIREFLRGLPSGIEETYKETMKRIRRQSGRDRIRAERALTWVFGADRQLDLVELQHGLAIMNLGRGADKVTEDDLPDEDAILSACQGLLVLVQQASDKPKLEPVHYTTKEYFATAYSTEFPTGHFEIAAACASYLSLRTLAMMISSHFAELNLYKEEDDLAYSTGGQPSGGFRAEPQKYPYIIWREFPLLDYAGRKWGFHLLAGDPTAAAAISPSDIFWQFGLAGFDWGSWLARPGVSHAKWCDGTYNNVLESYNAIEKVLAGLAEGGYNINNTDHEGRTMLYYAARSGNQAAVRFLLAQDGVDAGEPEAEDADPLLAATDAGLDGVVRVLMSVVSLRTSDGGDGEKQDERRSPTQGRGTYSLERLRNAQIKASKKSWYGNRKTLLELLLEKTKEVDNKEGAGLLHLALDKASSSSTELVTFLLERNLDVRARDEAGNTALHMAVFTSKHVLVEELLRKGLGPHATNQAGETALQVALNVGSFLIVLQLLGSSTAEMRRTLTFNAHSSKWTGGTPILWAAASSGYSTEEAIKGLLSAGADANVVDASRTSVLGHLASAPNFPSNVSNALIKNLASHCLEFSKPSLASTGLDLMTSLIDKTYPSEPNYYISHAESVLWGLLSNGANPRSQDSAGRTPYDHAVESSNKTFKTILDIHNRLTCGLESLDRQDEQGKTPLFHLAESKISPRPKGQIAKALLAAGADLNIQDGNGQTPIFAVGKGGVADLWTILEEAGADLNVRDHSGRRPELVRGDCRISMIFHGA